jgi:hypothetical protein
MQNANTPIVQWEGGDETIIHPSTILLFTADPLKPTPETEAEEI